MERYYNKQFRTLIIPVILLSIVVILIPFGMRPAYSSTAWRGSYFKGSKRWWGALVGSKNYIKVFHSQKSMTVLIYTLKFTVVAVIFKNITSLCLAMMVKKAGKGKGVFRTIYFSPSLLGGLAIGFVWSFIFQNVSLPILSGGDSPLQIPSSNNMPQDPRKAVIVMAMMVTRQTAGYMMLIYLNGLNNTPEDLYEAASIDGASAQQKFKSITAPMPTPAFMVVLPLTLSGSFRMLDENLALTEGNFGIRMLSLQILLSIRENTPSNYGMAQARAVIFSLLVAVTSIVQAIITK